MSKKKGLSFEEKKKTILDFMYDTATFYNLKEIEKIAPSKGVVSQSVKEVMEALTAENLVIQEKVGSQQLFWALRSQKAVTLMAKRDKENQAIEELTSKVKVQEKELSQLEAMAELPAEEIEKMKGQYDEECAKQKTIIPKLQNLRTHDPRQVAEKKRKLADLDDEITEWTDKVLKLRRTVCQSNGLPEQEFNNAFGIPPDLDEE